MAATGSPSIARRMYRIALALAAMVSVAAVLLASGGFFILQNLDQYRGELAERLSELLGQPVTIKGLQTLRIKETDRLAALQTELSKIAIIATIEDDSVLTIHAPEVGIDHSATVIRVATYHDHRMAMAFAPLALLLEEVQVEDPEVVRKSYPGFWADLLDVGFEVEFENEA